MKWIVKDKLNGKSLYWNDTKNEWSYSRDNATEYERYDIAEAVAQEEFGYVRSCECTIPEPPKLESNTKFGWSYGVT